MSFFKEHILGINPNGRPEPEIDQVEIEEETVVKSENNYCTKCGTPFSEEDMFCGGCGKRLKLATSNFAKKERKYVVEALSDKFIPSPSDNILKVSGNLPLNWFKFYVYFRLPFSILLSIIVISSVPAGYKIIELIDLLLLSVLFYGLHKRKLWAWTLNFVLIALETLAKALIYCYNQQIDEVSVVTLTLLVAYIVWATPNFIYFYKRKYLFN